MIPEYQASYIATPAEQAPAPYSGLGAPATQPAPDTPPMQLTLTPQQQGWLQLAESKNQLFAALQAGELRVQSILSNPPVIQTENPEKLRKEWKEWELSINQSKDIYSEDKEKRLSFTNFIKERIIDPAMEFEKRSENLIKSAVAHELEIKQTIRKIDEYYSALKSEENALVVHISNEQYRIALDYRQALLTRVHQFYVACLNMKTATPNLQDLRQELRKIQPGNMRKFERNLVSYDRACELLAEMTPYDPNTDLNDISIRCTEERFAMYTEDLKNAEAAAKQAEEQAQQAEAEAKAETELAMATNTLMGQAETVRIDTPKIKRKLKPVEENSQSWAFAVLAAFIKNNAAAAPKLRTKSWAKVSIGQMAKALADVASDTGEVFQGVQFREVEK